MTRIDVSPTGGDVFLVTVADESGSTRHRVTASPDDVAALAGQVDALALIEASFRFLLEREPKESILGRFDLPVIAAYFPEYPSEIRRRLGE
jgi:hypothetical protein